MATRATRIRVNRQQSEYTGEFRENTLRAAPAGSVTVPWEKLRLAHLTGEPEDITSTPDRRIWLGFDRYPNSVIDFRD